MTLAALVAAAGASERMGFAKALLAPSGGLPLPVTLCRMFRDAGATRLICTLPPDDKRRPEDRALLQRVDAMLAREGVVVVENRAWDAGLIGSVRAALDVAVDASALWMTPVDAPGTSLALLEAMVRAKAAAPDAALAPVVDGQAGHPVLLPSALFDAIRAFNGPGGVRALLENRVVPLPWSDARVCLSVDTPDAAAACSPPLVRWSG